MPVSPALSGGDYLLGVGELAAIAAALGYAAVRVRAWLLPGWSGAPARLAEAVGWLALLLWLSELAGAAGRFEGPVLVGAAVLTGLLVGSLATRRARLAAPSVPQVPPAPPAGALPLVATALAAAAVTAAWAVPTVDSLSTGIVGVDSMWYHLPQSARFVQTGSVLDLHFTDPYFLNWFYPANAELLHAVGMLAFERDLLSPLVNGGFLGLGLLAAWCIGRPWGLGPHTLIAAALVFATESMLEFQAGEARNDAAGLALFLAAVALLVNARAAGAGGGTGWSGAERSGTGLAGLAAGLAAGTKLSLLAPIGGLTAAAIVLARPGQRWRTSGLWLLATLAGGGFWYARNLAHAGNPLPWVDGLLPAPEQAVELRPRFSVSHYLTDWAVWEDWFLPGLEDGIGPLWPGLFGLAAAGAVLGLVLGLMAGRRPDPRTWSTRPFEGRAARAFGGRIPRFARAAEGRLLAVLGALVPLTVVAYVLTPLTASGSDGAPVGFVWNLRYLDPALALGAILLVLLPGARRLPWRWVLLLALFVLLLAQVALLDVWDRGAHTGWAADSAAAVLLGFALWAALLLRPPPAPLRVALGLGAALLAAVAIAGGYRVQESYLEDRYAEVWGSFQLDEVIAWANGVSGERIATAGRGGVFLQYGFYGSDLSNHVQWVGEPGPRGAWLPAGSCSQWRAAVNDGGYDYLVTTYDRSSPGDDRTSREREWIRTDPAAEEILREAPSAVYELHGPLDPAGCQR